MKFSFITGLAVFWSIFLAIMVGGFISYENQKATRLTQGMDEKGGFGDVAGIDGGVGSASDPSAAGTGASSNGSVPGGVTAEYMTSAYVAQHDSAQNCWLVIENKIYAVTDYVPVHPGGQQAITDKCGTDATVLFTTNGGGGHKHSESATQLLANYYIADLNSVIPGTERVVAPAATDSAVAVVAPESTPAADAPIGVSKFLIGDRVVTTDSLSVRKQAGASGEKLASEVVGTQGTVKSPSVWAEGAWWAYVAYKDGHTGWSSESYLKKYVENLIPTTPVKATETLTTTSVSTHNSRTDCYLIINSKVYDVTQYISFHPGGTAAITNYCGGEATNAFNTKGGGGSHSSNAQSLLANYYIGALGTAVEPVTPVAPTDDTTAPTVSFQSPLNGDALSGSITVSAFASDASGVASVKFSIDGTVIRTDTASPYSTSLDTTAYTNGSHTLKLEATDTAGNSNTASIVVTISNTTAPTPVSGLTTISVSAHNSRTDCYLIINSKVYDVTQYISFHPGGTAAITNYCGGEATNAFNTKGGGGSHSSSAQSLLANYYIGALNTTDPVTTPAPTTCSTFTYSSWSSCQSNSTQSRTVTASSPSGCTGGSPVTTQSCVYTPPVTTSGGLTSADVATHNSAGDCYLIISSKVYNVTQYIPFHPGGQSRITTRCGTDATSIFNGGSGSHNHSSSARNTLANYYVADLTTSSGGVTTPTTCSTFTYSSWSSCQSNSTQSRTVTASSPSGCTGGSPVTTQSCVYTPGGATTPQTSTVSVSASGSFSPSSLTIHAGDSIQFVWTGGEADEKNVSFSPSTISSFKMDHENTQFTRVFSSTGTWTFSSSGGTGTVTVQ